MKNRRKAETTEVRLNRLRRWHGLSKPERLRSNARCWTCGKTLAKGETYFRLTGALFFERKQIRHKMAHCIDCAYLWLFESKPIMTVPCWFFDEAN